MILRQLKRWTRTGRTVVADDSGLALVELALSVPLLLLLLLGMVEFGRITYAAIEVSNAARAAAQYGTANGGALSDSSGMLIAAQTDSYNMPSSPTLAWASGYPTTNCYCANAKSTSVSCSSITATTCTGSHLEGTLTVKLQVNYSPLIHWPGLPTSMTLTGYAQQQVLGL